MLTILGDKTMELAIILAATAAAVWFFVFRKKEDVQEAISPAPYKVDTPVVESTPVVEAPATVVEAPPAVAKAPAKKPRVKKPAAPKVEVATT
jgi:hypothetical protein